jgi:CheY-like chemotaxis protein
MGGESALEKAESALPDLILLDVMMPPGLTSSPDKSGDS